MATKNTKNTATKVATAKKSSPKKAAPTKRSTPKKKTETSYTKSLFIAIVIAVVGIGTIFFISKRSDNQSTSTISATGNAALTLESSAPSVAVGQKVHVLVYSNSKDENANAVQAYVTYPSEQLKLVSINSDKSAYPIKASETSSNNTIQISRGVIGGLTGKQLVTDIEFVAVAPGKAKFGYDQSNSVLVSSVSNKNIVGANGLNTTNIEVTQ